MDHFEDDHHNPLEDMDTGDPLLPDELSSDPNLYSTARSRPQKRRRSFSEVSLASDGLPPHNTDCDCESYSENDSVGVGHVHNPPRKQQRTEEGEEPVVTSPLPSSPPVTPHVDPPPVPVERVRTQREIDRERRNELLRPEVLRALSPRSLHRTLMANVNLDEFSFSDETSSFGDSSCDEFRFVPRRQPRPPRPVEYEVGLISPSRENPNPIEDMTSSTDEELFNTFQRAVSSSSSDWSAKNEAERGSFADSSDSESDSACSKRGGGMSTDSELSDQDKWFCTQCNAKTNIPYFRYCLRCFNIRRNWLPQRPKGKGKARPPPKVHRPRVRAPYTYPPEEDQPGSIPCSLPDEDRPNSISSNSRPSTGSTTPSTSRSTNETKPIPGPSRELSIKLQSALDAPPVSVAPASGIRDDPLCIICMAREKNAAFVHGKSAHFCCCFSCGDKILKRAGKCPICRRKILKVVKIII